MWQYKKEKVTSIDKLPVGSVGFIYKICDKSGKCYIGQKSLYSKRWIKISEARYNKLKSEGEAVKKTRDKKLSKLGSPVWVYKAYVEKESDWLKYQSSNTELKKKRGVTKEIIDIAYNKKQLTYLELKWMFHYDVLLSEGFYNGNIAGKYFKTDLI